MQRIRHQLMARRLSCEWLEMKALLHGVGIIDGAAELEAATGSPMEAAEGETTEQVPDFSLLDVNTTSATYNQTVSPRDFLGKTSAWYFGHAT